MIPSFILSEQSQEEVGARRSPPGTPSPGTPFPPFPVCSPENLSPSLIPERRRPKSLLGWEAVCGRDQLSPCPPAPPTHLTHRNSSSPPQGAWRRTNQVCLRGLHLLGLVPSFPVPAKPRTSRDAFAGRPPSQPGRAPLASCLHDSSMKANTRLHPVPSRGLFVTGLKHKASRNEIYSLTPGVLKIGHVY